MGALAENLARVRERIAAAARRARRDPERVTLVAVTKTQSVEVIREAVALGLRDIGENRVEEAEPKIAEMSRLNEAITWHMIGHIQSRKAREVVAHFDVIHSVDSARLAERLDRFAGERGQSLPILIECNVSGEQGKDGLPADRFVEDAAQAGALVAEMEQIVGLPHLQVRGLMTMAPIASVPEQSRPVFQQLRRLRDVLGGRFPTAGWADLSMGMTDDFEVAVEEGATLVRVGRAVFGERL